MLLWRSNLKRFVVICLLLVLACGAAVAQSVPGLEMHGYIQDRFYANPNASAVFAIDRVSISAKADLPNKVKMYVEYYIHPWVTDKVLANGTITGEQSRNYLESGYAEIPTKDGFLRVGKGRMLNFGITPAYGNRKTTSYGTVAETFTQDRVTGIQYCVKDEKLEAGLSITDASHVTNRAIGPYVVSTTNTVKHIAERDDNANLSGKLAIAGKIGWAYDNFKWHLSGSTSKMIAAEATAIAGFYAPPITADYVGNGTTNDRTMNKYGLDATYQKGNLFASAEGYRAQYSIVRVDGMCLILGYEPKDKPRYYISYNVLTNNLAPTAVQQTWDTRQAIVGYVYPISKGVWLEANYIRNMEVTGGGAHQVNNDMLFAELFTAI
jgi:hypothetical protein